MKPKNPTIEHPYFSRKSGFTLIELLIVIAIIAVLSVIGFMGTARFIEKGKKVQALAQFRDLETGMRMFEVDYRRPPIPKSKRETGWDTIYGDLGGNYSTQFLVAALAGENEDIPYGGENFDSKDANPREESYVVFPLASENKNGVGTDGKLYDPWGRETMVAINGMKSNNSDDELVDFNDGRNDRRLHTWGLAEYTDTRPKEQSFVVWSYGKDGMKGDGEDIPSGVVPFAGSDDVLSWR